MRAWASVRTSSEATRGVRHTHFWETPHFSMLFRPFHIRHMTTCQLWRIDYAKWSSPLIRVLFMIAYTKDGQCRALIRGTEWQPETEKLWKGEKQVHFLQLLLIKTIPPLVALLRLAWVCRSLYIQVYIRMIFKYIYSNAFEIHL